MKKNLNLLLGCCIFLTLSCGAQSDTDQIPEINLSQYEVSGGHHQPFILGQTSSPYGYFLFTPESYQTLQKEMAVLIFLHGYGERGNSQSVSSDLNKILQHGPPKMIVNGTLDTTNEMIVVSPQCHDDWWNRDKLKEFIEYVIKEYKIDKNRVYLTGLSMGGYATFDLLSTFGEDLGIAAAVPICGKGEFNEVNNNNIAKTPIWVFHGNDDTTVTPEYSKKIVPAINDLDPKVEARLTIFPGVGHDSWTMTYSGSGMGKEDSSYDAFNQSIFDWMYQYTR